MNLLNSKRGTYCAEAAKRFFHRNHLVAMETSAKGIPMEPLGQMCASGVTGDNALSGYFYSVRGLPREMRRRELISLGVFVVVQFCCGGNR